MVNIFDGVIIDHFNTRIKAEKFARDNEAKEAHRIKIEYP